MQKKYHKDAPPLPNYKENDISSEVVVKKLQTALETFVRRILEIAENDSDLQTFVRRILEIAENDSDLLHFFELLPEQYGYLWFYLGSGIIHAEVRMKKHSGGRYT